MATNKLQWKRIAKGEELPCQSFLRKKNGEILKLSTVAGVKVGQDAYYLPVDDVIEEIRNYPIEESKDEKMIQYFKDLAPFDKAEELYEKYGFSHKDAIAWLEKKGEQEYTKKDIDDAYLKGVCDAKHELEKQVEPTDIPADAVLDSNKDGLIADTIQSKPKFKTGDWVVVDDGRIGRIIECTKYFADVDLKFSRLSTRVSNIRSWTIQDAKDGDVLVDMCDSLDNPLIFILKDCKHIKHELGTLSDYHSFCYLKASKKQEFCIDGWHNEHNLMPATKEQRDLLFQKMHEAGYEWDAEKKELKKIEQKTILDVEIPFGTDSELVEEAITIPDGCYAIIEDNKVILRKGEKKPAEWSKEDEVMLSLICEYIPFSLGGRMWLKSLKDRIQPQPQQMQGWSEEDEQLYNDLSDTYFYNDEDYPEETYKLMLKRVLDWMNKRAKSLRPRSQWKPSKEQMNGLKEAIEFLGCTKTRREQLQSLYEQLKKLREE